MIVLVTGGRDYTGNVSGPLEAFHKLHNIEVLIHGGARGADSRCAEWAAHQGIHLCRIDALWEQFGKSAGYLRNAAMLKLRPDWLIAFPGGKGTADMVKRSIAANVPVWAPYE